MSALEQEQQRLQTLNELGVLEAESFPVFEEATQTAAHFLDTPICILSVIDCDRQLFKSAVGLSRVGLMNMLASSRQIPRQESFCNYVIERQQVLIVPNVADYPDFAKLLLAQRYGIQAYLGVPLMASNGCCIGTLAVMELAPRLFTAKEAEFLELMARWSMSEFERNRLLKAQQILQDSGYTTPPSATVNGAAYAAKSASITSVKTALITQMTQELRTPLTSILGMASVLNREIYGPLTDRQKKYMDVVHNSGQYLLTLVNEILELGALDDISPCLDLSPVDVEMLCQQALNTLEQAAHRREQQVQLTVEPGSRIWLLDKDKVRQMLYHLVFSVIQSSSTGSIIRIHISRKRNQLSITVWTSHPWLGDGLPQAELHSSHIIGTAARGNPEPLRDSSLYEVPPQEEDLGERQISNRPVPGRDRPSSDHSRQSLGLLLSRCLAEVHGGQITIQGSSESGYRYVISLPKIAGMNDDE